jgi:hypothetical protein
MKNILVLFLLTLSVVLFQSLNAQEKNSSIEKAVLQLKEALLSGNEAQLRAISSKHLSYGHSNGLIENQDAFVATLISGKSVFLSIDLSEQTMDQVENTAIVRHTLYAKTNNEGVLGEVKLKVLMIFQKEKGAWKLLARQAVKIPI